MLGQRLRRWLSIKTALGEHLSFAGFPPDASGIVSVITLAISDPRVSTSDCHTQPVFTLRRNDVLYLHCSVMMPSVITDYCTCMRVLLARG